MRAGKLRSAVAAFGALMASLLPAHGAMAAVTPPAASAAVSAPAAHLSCATGALVCTEVQDPEEVFGEGRYIGHDEPATLFYSNEPGSGNRMRYEMTLPRDPVNKAIVPGKSFNFQLHPAFWFGMAMCDVQSYPEQLSTCTPDSDSNIVDPAVSPKHPGTAFMELQFYPPGWVKWPAAAAAGGTSCDATRWCIALNIDSLSRDPVTGKDLNGACAARVGIEYVNFAFLTRNGKSFAPANPVQATPATTLTPDPQKTFFMNSGDRLSVTLHDTEHGLKTQVNDLTTGESGSMTASAANGFGMVKFAPNPSTECTNIPYDFHPMYGTSSEQTRVIWAAHSFNISFSDEIGHFDYCTEATPIPATAFGASCPGADPEGSPGDQEPTDGDDNFCFPASRSSLVQVPGCTDTNTGFDGVPYQNVWPDGNQALHGTPILFTSPLTGEDYSTNYARAALEADLPRIEFSTCNRSTGAGCTLIPTTDDGSPAAFYPWFSISNRGGEESRDRGCQWLLGNDVPGLTTNDFGKNAGYGSLLQLTYLAVGGGGATIHRFNDFRQIFSSNPCPNRSGD